MTTSAQLLKTSQMGSPTHWTRVTFTGNENHLIPLHDAIRLTEDYRLSAPEGCALSGFFGKQSLTKLLNQDSCVGMRIYFASQDNGFPCFVMVGVKPSNTDLISGFLIASPVTAKVSLISRLRENNFPDFASSDSLGACDQIYSGDEIQLISLAEASQLTRNFRNSAQSGVIKGGFFSRNIFQKILDRQECTGIHVYNGLRSDRQLTLVLAGGDNVGRHFAKWPFGDELFPCPPFCAPNNSLNH